MTQIDEKQEAIAKIRMTIDNDAAAREAKISSADFKEGDELSPNLGQSVWAAPDNVNGHSPHWIFGSPENPINSLTLEIDMSAQGDASFKEFDERLRDFLSLYLPDEAIQYEDLILVILNIHILSLLLLSCYFLNHRSGYINVFM
jgi:hypothetical protein